MINSFTKKHCLRLFVVVYKHFSCLLSLSCLLSVSRVSTPPPISSHCCWKSLAPEQLSNGERHMHIIIDRTLTMYSLHDTCNVVHDQLIVTASLHRKNKRWQPRVLKSNINTNTWFSTLYLLTPCQCDDIGGGVLTLETPNSSRS